MIKTTKYPMEPLDMDLSIAMAYVPFQGSPDLNECLEEGFLEGTVFPELVKPFMGRRSCCS